MNFVQGQTAASRCDAATHRGLLACGYGLLIMLVAVATGCESDAVDRHASNRALRSPMAVTDPSYEAQDQEPPHALAVVEFPNGPHGTTHVSTVLDPILGRPTATSTELKPVTPSIPVGTGIQLQSATTPSTAPATAPATNLPRGGNDSTTQP